MGKNSLPHPLFLSLCNYEMRLMYFYTTISKGKCVCQLCIINHFTTELPQWQEKRTKNDIRTTFIQCPLQQMAFHFDSYLHEASLCFQVQQRHHSNIFRGSSGTFTPYWFDEWLRCLAELLLWKSQCNHYFFKKDIQVLKTHRKCQHFGQSKLCKYCFKSAIIWWHGHPSFAAGVSAELNT